MSIQDELLVEIRKLKVSEPVFQLRSENSSWRGPQLKLCLIQQAKHQHDAYQQANTPLQYLANKHFSESFDVQSHTFVVDVSQVLAGVRAELRNYFRTFTAESFGRDSDICKWYDNYVLTERNIEHRYIETLLGLYKYILQNVDAMLEQDINKHQQNAIALLELIHQRDFKEEHVPQRTKRRRRRK